MYRYLSRWHEGTIKTMRKKTSPQMCRTSFVSTTGTHLNILNDVSPTVTHFFSLKWSNCVTGFPYTWLEKLYQVSMLKTQPCRKKHLSSFQMEKVLAPLRAACLGHVGLQSPFCWWVEPYPISPFISITKVLYFAGLNPDWMCSGSSIAQ